VAGAAQKFCDPSLLRRRKLAAREAVLGPGVRDIAVSDSPLAGLAGAIRAPEAGWDQWSARKVWFMPRRHGRHR
jgi:hypothetical protein